MASMNGLHTLNTVIVNDKELLPYNTIEIRSGKKPGWGVNILSAHNDAISTTETTIGGGLPVNGINIITFPASAALMAFASDDANDTSAGTGLRTMLVIYLDSNYNELTEVITLNGTTKVSSVASMLRVNLMLGLTAGSSGFNIGTIFVGLNSDSFSGGAPDTAIFHTLESERNLSAMGIITVPNGKMYYPTSVEFTSDSSANKSITILTKLGDPNSLTAIVAEDIIAGSGLVIPLEVIGPLSASNDIQITGTASSGTVAISTALSFFVEDVAKIF